MLYFCSSITTTLCFTFCFSITTLLNFITMSQSKIQKKFISIMTAKDNHPTEGKMAELRKLF